MTLAASSAAASPLDTSCPAEAEVACSSTAAQYIADGCLIDGPLGRVGLELEAHCFDPVDPYRRPRWEEITEILGLLPPLPGGSAVTVEPGGAVELSGPPEDGVVAAIAAMNNDQAVLRKAFADSGLGLVFLGADPLRSPQRINPGARYRAMEQFFAASDSGEAGAAMMTSTASVQVNLDAGPQAGWAARVRLAHALGPTMIAIAANSPMLGGEFSGWVSTRQWVWGQMDSARCGPILGASGDDPGTDWARYALKAPVMLVHNPDAVPVTHWVPFADWADGRRVARRSPPHHRRPGIPPDHAVPAGTPTAVAGNPLPRQHAGRVLARSGVHAGRPARRPGRRRQSGARPSNRWPPRGTTRPASVCRDRRLYEAANRCVAVAAEKAPAELNDAMERLVRCVEKGRCPGDDFADQVIEHGIAAEVSRVAQSAQGGL